MTISAEFIVDDRIPESSRELYIKAHRGRYELEIGNLIADKFEWENPVLDHPMRHRLIIEAFPREKWIEFKNFLFGEILNSSNDSKKVLEKIKELEFYGKPAGEAKKSTI